MTVKSLRNLLVVCGLVVSAPWAGADPSPRSGPRLWAAAGPSFEGRSGGGSGGTGYTVNGGIEFGRVVSLTLEAGYEHLPSGEEPYLTNNLGPGPPVLRVESAGGRSMISGMIGVRAALPSESLEPFVDVAVGTGAHRDPGRRLVDPATGAEVYPASAETSSALLAEAGIGVRTRRASGPDFLLALRGRIGTGVEDGGVGQSFQLRIGILTP